MTWFRSFILTMALALPRAFAADIQTPVVAPDARVVRVRVANEAQTLDWNRANDATSALLVSQIMRGLYRVNSRGEITEDLARSFRVTENKVRIEIIRDHNWSDGVPLRAQHFVDSIQRLLSSESASPFANYLFDIKGARDFHTGKTAALTSVKADGDHALILELDRPSPQMKALLTHPCVYPIRLDLLKSNPQMFLNGETLAVLGPYRIRSRKLGDVTKLEPLATPKNAPGPRPQPIEWRVVDSDPTATDLFTANQLDLVLGLSPLAKKAIGAADSAAASAGAASLEPALAGHVGPSERATALSSARGYSMTLPIDRVQGLLVSPKLRASVPAWSQAVNRDDIVKALRGKQVPTTSWLNTRYAVSAKVNVETGKSVTIETKAKPSASKLKSASDQKLPPEIASVKLPKQRVRLLFIERSDNRVVAEVLQAQLKRAGLELELVPRDLATYMALLKKPEFDLILFAWNAGFPDALSFLEIFRSNGFLAAQYANPKFDESLNTHDYARAQSLLIEQDHALVPLYVDTMSAMIRAGLTGYELRSGRVPFSELRWSR